MSELETTSLRGTNQSSNRNISRKKFLQICQSVVAGGSILGVSGFILRKNHILKKDGLAGNALAFENRVGGRSDPFISPYRFISSFSVAGPIESFDMAGENLLIATSNHLYLYDRSGSLLHTFSIRNNLRDIATDQEHIYLLFPARIEVYNHDGVWLRQWEAMSETSDFCSMTVGSNALFVTDAGDKHICKFTTEGDFVKIIKSPDGFVIPSYTFGITCSDGILYCSNSGRHRIEKYSFDGDYLGSFGKAGDAEGMFCGCCNPVHLTHTASGEIITSEKGIPRISCYGKNGEFRCMLLDSKALGGGNTACEVKIHNNRLFVAAKNLLSTFQYDSTFAANSACAHCSTTCSFIGNSPAGTALY